MNTRIRSAAILAASAAALIHVPAFATDFIKLQNTTALNQAGSWTNLDDPDGIPDADDVLVWDGTFTTPVNPRTAGSLSPLGGDLVVQGIRISTVGGTPNVGATAVGFQNASSANTLAIGNGGIDMSGATQAFYLESKLAMTADQTWIINNANTTGSPTGFNNGEDLSLRAQVGNTTTASTAFNLGGFSVTTSGAGAVTVSSGYAITNGTINIGNTLFLISGGDSRLVTVGSNVNLNVGTGSILHFQSNSAGVASTANIALNGGTLKLVSNNATQQVSIGGTTTVNSASTLLIGNNVGGGSTAATNGIIFTSNLVGAAPLTVTNSASSASVVLMGGNNSGYTGNISFGGTTGRITRLTTANSGSAAATWSVAAGQTLEVNGVTVELGTLNGAGTVSASSGTATLNIGSGNFSGAISNGSGVLALTKNTNGTLTLSGANNYSGATTVNAGTLIVTPGAINGSSVAVAAGAMFAMQAATSGTVSATGITVADGATILTRPLTSIASVTVPSITAGTSSGATVAIDTGALGNPTVAPLFVTNFNPVAGTTVKILGTNLSTGVFPLINYTNLGGGGFAGLTLSLPFRVSGNLLNNPNSLTASITVVKPSWRGNINGNWDIDSTGTGGEGTANWSATSGPNTYVESSTLGSDNVVFDDSLTGSPVVNLTTALSPAGVTVNNAATAYTFGGSGSITGPAFLIKTGAGTLTVANIGTNSYSGGTTISNGTLRVGDGVTLAGGSLGTGTITVNAPGVLELNRPDDFGLGATLSGNGGLTKSQPNIATIPNATTFPGNVTVNAGTLRFGAAATLSGNVVLNSGGTLTLGNAGIVSAVMSGVGALEAAGGTVAISGTTPNTHTGLTTISAGTLQLNKTPNVQAIGGDILITGGGVLAILAPEQIADTSTITFTGTSADCTAGTNSLETVANVICNPSSSAGQFQLRFGFTVTGLATLNNGVLGVSSGSTATVNAVNMTGGILRIAGNSAASTLNIGAGGITASGGEIQVKFNTNAQDAVLNLGGNFTATGNVFFTNAGYGGPNLNVINLTGTRTFDIAGGTFTTISPDIAGPGGLIKTGDGTLTLDSLSAATYTGPTSVEAGTLAVIGSISGTPSITVKQNAILDVGLAGLPLATGQSLRGGGSILGNVTLAAGASLAPGDIAGTLNFATGNLDLSAAVASPNVGALNFELETPATSDKVNLIAGTLNIGLGALDFADFTFTALPGFEAGAYVLFDGIAPIIGSLDSNPVNLTGTIGGFSGTLELQDGGNDLVLMVVPEPGSATLLLGGLAGLVGLRRNRRNR